jgi:tetratricopeptide (TPR) repeat protein
MSTDTAILDAEELLHLALRASAQNHHEEAISCLKRAIEKKPESAKLHYMLGAEHAEIGLYERAVEEISNAVKLDPKLDTAHFQLGLLHITSGRVQQAIDAWKSLDQLGSSNFLYLFKKGLIHLTNNEFDECVNALEKGILQNNTNAALNRDMKRIIDEVKSRELIASKQTTDDAAQKGKNSQVNNVLLAAYQNNKEEKQ